MDFLNSVAETLTTGMRNGWGNGGLNYEDWAGQRAHAPQFQQAMDPQTGGNRGAPPASLKALRQLPIVKVAPEDLVDENNRECCICLEENHLKDRVMRLPCAHIFHHRCIVDWLTKHCTCPVCRYELPTDDPQYEKSRKARMKSRKPRIHKYVLERMPYHELQEMARELKIRWPRKIKGKADILDAFEQSGRIEIIAAPEPVEYALKELRAMGVSRLRRAMEEAGVFFDPIDVVEKEDMVQIFCNSGRLVLRPDTPTESAEYEDKKASAADSLRSSWEQQNVAPSHGRSMRAGASGGIIVETVEEDDTDVIFPDREDATAMFENLEPILNPDRAVVEERPAQVSQVASVEDVTMNDVDSNPAISLPDDPSPDEQISAPNEQAIEEDVELEPASPNNSVSTDAAIAADYARYDDASISELRDAAQRLNVDLSRCIERSEMVEKLVRANNGQRFSPEDFDQWSVSDLRALSTAVGVSLSQGADRADMIRQLLRESENRPYVASYIGSLMPLASLNVTELRAVARRLHVNVSTCIEKEEMIHRLVSATLNVEH